MNILYLTVIKYLILYTIHSSLMKDTDNAEETVKSTLKNSADGLYFQREQLFFCFPNQQGYH